MEFVEGETLQGLVKREGPISARDILEIALQVTRALSAAQREKLVHRDLKPANVMLAHQDGELLVKVIDFGLAKSNGDLDEGSRARPPAWASSARPTMPARSRSRKSRSTPARTFIRWPRRCGTR